MIYFQCSNFFIVPTVYFFYPETAYRSLEEMDTIFHKSKSIWDTVSVAKLEPRRYGKNGELLINYEDTTEFQANADRRASVRVRKTMDTLKGSRAANQLKSITLITTL